MYIGHYLAYKEKPFCVQDRQCTHKRNIQARSPNHCCRGKASSTTYQGADKSLAQPGRKQARKHVTDACDFNIEMQAVIKFFFPPCKARR